MELYKTYELINDNIEIENYNVLKNIPFKIFFVIIFYLILNFSFSPIIIIRYQRKLIKTNNNQYTNNYFWPRYYLNNSEYFKITYFKYYFSLKYNIIKIDYKIGFYDKNNNVISPSKLALYKNLHVICFIEENINIDSLANIFQNQYFNCIEFLYLKKQIKFGIKIYQIEENIQYSVINLFNEDIFNYNNLFYENDDIFDPLFINKKYISLIRNINNQKINEVLKIKKLYLQCPYTTLKENSMVIYNKWEFKNIYNYHFCFCKGNNCLDTNVAQKCKFNFYLYIIDNNREIYKKTDYLFIDFIFAKLPFDDTYPLFKEMIKQNLPVHYLTEKSEIYNEYCNNEINCLSVIKTNKENFIKYYGDFLEKYIELFFKLKVVVSAKKSNFITKIFYYINYITYIYAGNGILFFKPFFYFDIYFNETNKFDKLLLPPSNKIISIVKKMGWNDEDIIKINLPRWEKYNNKYILNYKEKIENNIIFMFFGWRNVKKDKLVSNYYFENIKNIIKNELLNKEIEKNNKILYFTIYRSFAIIYKKKFIKLLKRNKFIQFIEQDEISECIRKTSLFITDFSSIIFDIIYRRKPFIIFIPDHNDPQIKNIYENEYYDLIQSIKNGTISFENKFFDINQTINKIIYYIHNNFKLEKKLEDFYNSFGFINENGINKLIEYLKNLK